MLTKSTYSDGTQASKYFQGTLCFNNLPPIPSEKSQTVLPSDLHWFLHVGKNLSIFIQFSYFLTFLICAAFSFCFVCIVTDLKSLYLIVSSRPCLSFFVLSYGYPGPVCINLHTLRRYNIPVQIKILSVYLPGGSLCTKCTVFCLK